MADLELHVVERSKRGKAEARRSRRENTIPAVVYGGGKDTILISIDHDDILHATEDPGFFSQILTLKTNKSSTKVVIKDMQRHAYKPKILHIDFLRVRATEKLTINVPIQFIGEEENAAVKAGAVMSKIMNEVEIKCLPADLPERIELDVRDLEQDQTIHLSRLKLPEGVELAMGAIEDEAHDRPVVSVIMSKLSVEAIEQEQQEAAALAAEKEAEAAEAEEKTKGPEAASESGGEQKPEGEGK